MGGWRKPGPGRNMIKLMHHSISKNIFNSTAKTNILVFLLFAVSSYLLYRHTLHVDFLLDDVHLVKNNPLIKGFSFFMMLIKLKFMLNALISKIEL